MITNKHILITGVSRGLGFAIAEECLVKGNFVYGISRSISDGIEALKAKYATQFKHFEVDLAQPDLIYEHVFTYFKTNKIGLDALINNAATAYDELVTHAEIEPLLEMININQVAPVMLTKYSIKNMLLYTTKGTIINISSVCAHTGYKGLSMYAGTKGFLESYSKSIAREWGKMGITSNCIAAGFMETDMSSNIDQDTKTKIYNRTSLRKSTDIDSVVSTAIFLMSEGAKSITGQTMHVDSGTI